MRGWRIAKLTYQIGEQDRPTRKSTRLQRGEQQNPKMEPTATEATGRERASDRKPADKEKLESNPHAGGNPVHGSESKIPEPDSNSAHAKSGGFCPIQYEGTKSNRPYATNADLQGSNQAFTLISERDRRGAMEDCCYNIPIPPTNNNGKW